MHYLYIIATLLLQCCHFAVTLLLQCCYTIIPLESHLEADKLRALSAAHRPLERPQSASWVPDNGRATVRYDPLRCAQKAISTDLVKLGSTFN
jgi:hypothetical protein